MRTEEIDPAYGALVLTNRPTVELRGAALSLLRAYGQGNQFRAIIAADH